MPVTNPAESITLDQWSFFDHKAVLTEGLAGRRWLAPTWVPDESRRRLAAYLVCRGYVTNSARQFLALTDQAAVEERREFGDADLLVGTVRSAVVGNAPALSIDHADDKPDEERPDPDDPEAEDVDPDDTDPADTEAAEALAARWDDYDAAHAAQEWLDEWAAAEHAVRAILEGEDDAGICGDAVYVVQWTGKHERPRLRVFDADSYFPVYEPGQEDEFPERVHFAWGERFRVNGELVDYVRRITYEVVLIADAVADGVDLDGVTNGQRTYAYDDEASPYVCLLTDARWRFDALADRRAGDFDPAKATYLTNGDGEPLNRFDTGHDFIPVVHVPNTNAVKQPWGRSSLAVGAQVLDELSAADSDLSSAAATSGTPMVSVAGGSVADEELVYGPGSILRVDVDGRLDVVDTTSGVTTLIGYRRHLEQVLSTNSRVPEAAMGRIDPAKIEAGIILMLTMGPFAGLIDEMRLVRAEKYALLIKMVQRVAMVNGDDRIKAVLPGGITFGSYLPTDQAQLVELVAKLCGSGGGPVLITRSTALRMLNEGGVTDLDDLAAESDAAMAEDVAWLNGFLDATNDTGEVRRRAGLEPAAPTGPRSLPAPGGVQLPAPGVPTPGVPPPAPQPAPPVPPAGQ